MVLRILNHLNRLCQFIFIFAFINHLGVIFLLEFKCGLPFFFKGKDFKKSRITHFLLTEVVDYPPLVGVIVHDVHDYIHGRNPRYP